MDYLQGELIWKYYLDFSDAIDEAEELGFDWDDLWVKECKQFHVQLNEYVYIMKLYRDMYVEHMSRMQNFKQYKFIYDVLQKRGFYHDIAMPVLDYL